MTGSLERRARQFRSRVLVRSWEYRQRDLSHGAWYRLRRALAFAAEAYVVEEAEAEALVAEGFPVERAGAELEPRKLVVRVSATRAATLRSARSVPVRLEGELLAARAVVLVPFELEADRR